MRQVATSGVLHELASGEGASQQQPRELLRAGMSTNSSILERFLSALQEGEYDAAVSKVKVNGHSYINSLQKQIGCFIHRVVTLVTD